MSEDDESEEIQKGGKQSQEESKKSIVEQLVSINSQVRCQTRDLETRLDKAYRSGVGKKYGYSSVGNLSV